MKTYSAGSDDLCGHLERMKELHHDDLDGVTVAALFVFDEESTEPVLKHQGYPAQAICRITPIRDRALGVAVNCTSISPRQGLGRSHRAQHTQSCSRSAMSRAAYHKAWYWRNLERRRTQARRYAKNRRVRRICAELGIEQSEPPKTRASLYGLCE